MNVKDLIMEKSEISKIAEKMAFEAGLTYHPETNAEWGYIDFNNSGRDGGRVCIILMNNNILTVNDHISYLQHDCLKLLKKAIDELQNIMLDEIKMNKATKKHEIRSAGIKYEA
jgi:hypothetical protein